MNEPAFPATEVQGGTDGVGCKDGVWHYTGMTLRDYFAAKAMQSLILAEHSKNEFNDIQAVMAYEMADAMLKERIKQ